MKISPFLFLFLSLTSAGEAQSMFRGNAARTGIYPGTAPREFHRVKWKFPTGARVVGSPVIQDKVIYFGSDDGNVYAVDAESGQQIWKTTTRGPVPCTPAIDHGTVYVGSYDGKFYALNAQSGAVPGYMPVCAALPRNIDCASAALVRERNRKRKGDIFIKRESFLLPGGRRLG